MSEISNEISSVSYYDFESRYGVRLGESWINSYVLISEEAHKKPSFIATVFLQKINISQICFTNVPNCHIAKDITFKTFLIFQPFFSFFNENFFRD